ncbi:MAG: peroxiredoxin [Flavobacteriales bacterium]
MALLGKTAPAFAADALVDGGSKQISLSDYKGKYVVFFYYPKDDTGVCGSEVHAFHKRISEFEERGAQVIAASVDDMASHIKWSERDMSDGGIKGLAYPIIEDPSRNIAARYDVLAGEWKYNADGTVITEGDLITFRGLFIIDPKGAVRHQLVNDIPLGRSVDECLRNLDAIKNLEENGEVCMVHSSK